MHRIDTTHRAVDLFGSGKDGYAHGTPGSMTVRPTETDAAHFNALQEELCYAIEEMGIALTKGTNTQLLQAFKTLLQLSVAQSTWTLRTHGANETVYGSAYAAAFGSTFVGRTVLVGTTTGASPYIIISDDGTTWTAVTEGTNVDLHAVDYDRVDLFVAVGAASGGKAYIATSSTGSVWTKQAGAGVPSVNVDLNGIAYNTGNVDIWVAVGNDTGGSGPYIITSSNGVNWTQRTMTGPVTADLECVAHNGQAGADGLWVAAGFAATDALVLSSPAGAVWTTRVSATSGAFGPRAVAHNQKAGAAGLWVIVGYNSAAACNVMTSADGITWAEVGVFGTSYLFNDVKFINGVWVAVGYDTSVGIDPVVATSLDGTTWTRIYQGGSTFPLNTLVSAGGSRIIAAGDATGASPLILESMTGVV
jgi:hypothetical protein